MSDAADRMFNHPTTPSETTRQAPAPAMTAADRIYSHPTSGPSSTGPVVTAKPPVQQAAPMQKPAPAAEPSSGPDGGKEMAKSEADAGDDGGDPLEGFDFDATSELVDEFRETATDLGLDKTGVARLVALEEKRNVEFWDNQSDKWVGELQREPDFDGMSQRARRIAKRYGDASFAEFAKSPYGNHPGLVRLLDRIAKDMEGH
jgi:hypothetical protein